MRDDLDHLEPLGQTRSDEMPADTSWMAPDPPPIPDRIRKKVDPRRPTLPSLPTVPVKVTRHWLKAGFIGGGVVILALVAALLFRGSDFDAQARAQWATLCDDYARWFAPLAKSVDHSDQMIMRDLGFGSVVDTLADAERFDPRVIADRPQANLAAIGQQPPPTARRRDAIKSTGQAAAALRRIENTFAQWPTTLALQDHHTLLVEHGWDRVAELVENTLEQGPPYGNAPVGPALIDMQRVEAHTARIALAIEHLDAELAVLEPINDPVFNALIQAVRDLDHDAPVARYPELHGDDPYTSQLVGLSEALEPLEAFATRFRGVVQSDRWRAIDHPRFRESGQAYAMLAAGDQPVTTIFRTWLDEADGFRGVEDDWRPAWAEVQHQALAPAESCLRTLEAAGHLTAKPLAKRIDDLHQRIDTLADMPLSAGMQREMQVQREIIERDIRDLVTSAERLRQEVNAQQTAQTLRGSDPLTSDPKLQSAAAEAAWQAHRGRLADRLERTGDLDEAAAALEESRQELLALIHPDRDTGLPAPLRFDLQAHDDATAQLLSALQQRSVEQREATLTVALEHGLPVDKSRWSKLRAQNDRRLTQARALADLAIRIEQHHAGAYPLDDRTVANGDASLEAEVAEWSGSSLVRDSRVAETAGPVFERITNQRAFDEVDRWDTLPKTVLETTEPATAFAAWRRMEQVDWPGDARAVEVEVKLQDHLSILVDAIHLRDPGRAAALREELAEALPRRWVLAMRSAEGDEQLRHIADRAAAMRVTSVGLPADVRYNLMLHRAQSALATLPTPPGPRRDTEVLALGRTLGDQVRPLTDDPRVGPLVEHLDAVTARGAAHRELVADAGPARRGWALQPHENPQTLTFTRDGWSLTFVRVDPDQGQPFYVATTEFPVGLAMAAADRDGVAADLAEVIRQRGDEDTRKGPRPWVYGDGRIALNPHNWLDGSPPYLRDLTPSPPRERHPVTYISAEGASYLAALLGCRLPTVDQWNATMQRFPVPPRSLPNLRDTTWARHALHVNRLIQAGVSGVDWANSDVFHPIDDASFRDDPVGDFHPINDATLWFTFNPPTTGHGQPPAPTHLVGNVAEIVTIRPIDPSPLLNDRQPLDQRRDAFRQAHKDHFAVIGGSALSPASLNPTVPQPFNVFAGAKGYADVGLRLVFEVPVVSPARQAEQSIRQASFLPP